jgi:ATP synthase protein I
MNNKNKKHLKPKPLLSNEVAPKIARKLKARSDTSHGVWFGLGMMGLVGWSIAVPTLLGAGIGIYLDNHYKGKISWTLTLLITGLIIGCLNVWHWMRKEENEIRKKQESNHE